ncbi:hypothetical protein ACB496_12855 [Lelliottia nimipressuralis]|uniref:hypothetical protein n=1 Tax=Lelliottia nimipressuralis TaxID=69220 RepID=UPI003555D03E
MTFDELKPMLPKDGKVLLRVSGGEIQLYALIPEDHITLSLEAFIEYAERLGWEIKKK